MKSQIHMKIFLVNGRLPCKYLQANSIARVGESLRDYCDANGIEFTDQLTPQHKKDFLSLLQQKKGIGKKTVSDVAAKLSPEFIKKQIQYEIETDQRAIKFNREHRDELEDRIRSRMGKEDAEFILSHLQADSTASNSAE